VRRDVRVVTAKSVSESLKRFGGISLGIDRSNDPVLVEYSVYDPRHELGGIINASSTWTSGDGTFCHIVQSAKHQRLFRGDRTTTARDSVVANEILSSVCVRVPAYIPRRWQGLASISQQAPDAFRCCSYGEGEAAKCARTPRSATTGNPRRCLREERLYSRTADTAQPEAHSLADARSFSESTWSR
jgi:hypothetical protein